MSTGTDVRELSKQSSSESEQLVKTEQIKETPFVWVPGDENANEGEGFMALGQYKIWDNVTKKQCEVELDGINWEVMIAIIGAITDQTIRTYKGEL